MQNLLSDLVVVDLTRALAGPHAAMMLGDLGARVIKVETPAGGDDSRGWGPPFVGPPDDRESTYFLSANRNKESVTADLKSPDGKEFLTKLVGRADVLIENFRPGVLDRLGFSVERLHDLNPGLVILSITGFGHDGPDGGRAGYDQIAQGEGGLMSVTGAVEPTKVGVPIADLLAGMYGAYGAVAALHERSITGKGRVVRTSLLASVVGVHAFHGTKWTVAGELPERVGNHHAQIAPYGLYRTRDDIVQVAVGSEGQWKTFAPIVGLDPADSRFSVNSQRVAHRDELTAAIEDAFAAESADVWLQRLADAGIPAGKVRDFQQVYEWEQTLSQGLLIDVEHPSLGRIQLPGPPLRFDDNPHAGARSTNLPPPRLGEHNESVQAWLDEPQG
ncbi:crotonobetainyl-CoA:carnitine CoA-transferase CaiB-like acyl-CoA transferase [Kribbella sp. VKM Ac-2527]|uniref:Crotonobetainyl-CoA:carnitine CoA-transferase CaiB-like acyl-CoA transferase n=1 Tax=Kribbella caucasensis TaxID=2512215 RepID=A0A4R6KAA0_9ACTN|nr:CoA transferase [Kribbella sp. VKM Ac-2527]TDO46216.1 crotonobetainyl-CoA:carnitine CoA-transferase CaiB-like acyl-CoA transferase [Kribbella sp. VKM Ac-2527]